ncbi:MULTISPECIES: hypothetical protein [unclassified Streptomyces]|uniref:hypothetical protein n=1 Tax=unclassified Streptomyces TaxID=2593676 RepID=UPI00344E6111
MRISAVHISTGDAPNSQYVTAIAPRAAKLVREQCGSLPHALHLILNGDSRQLDNLANTAETQLLPGTSPAARPDRQPHAATGKTTLDHEGVLIILQIAGKRSEQDIAEALVHQLVHAHQLGDRAARSLHFKYLKHVWGQQPMKPITLSAYELLIDQREIEANGAEGLAAQL